MKLLKGHLGESGRLTPNAYSHLVFVESQKNQPIWQ
jgi:hypothetical protein